MIHSTLPDETLAIMNFRSYVYSIHCCLCKCKALGSFTDCAANWILYIIKATSRRIIDGKSIAFACSCN